MRAWGSLLVLGACAFWCAPALADGPRVIATIDNVFTPKTVTIEPGGTVNFENRGSLHNVKFEDGQFEQPADPMATPWFVWRTFDREGEYRYYCENHGGPGGAGMSGTVFVVANAAPTIAGLAVSPSKVCNSKRCRKRGGRIEMVLSEAARVIGSIDPIGKPAGRRGDELDVQGRAGSNSIKLPVTKLKPGRYRLTVTAEDFDGNESDAAKVKFSVYRPSK
jgi:plastocyanin